MCIYVYIHIYIYIYRMDRKRIHRALKLPKKRHTTFHKYRIQQKNNETLKNHIIEQAHTYNIFIQSIDKPTRLYRRKLHPCIPR